MSTLIPIREPGATAAAGPSWRAFLELGFRPLYLAGASWALVSVLIWIFVPHWAGGELAGLPWHAHEMLWGFVATIAIGFLLTAGANWTGITPLAGPPLGALLALWAAARVGYLLPQPSALWVAAAAEFLFFAVAAAAMGRAVWRSRNRRNYIVPFLMLGLGLTHLLYIAWLDDWTVALRGFHAGLLVMALIALLVARRVIPFFAMRAVQGLQIPMHDRSASWQQWAAGVAVAALLAGWGWLQAAALALAGAISLWQVISWRPAAVRARPILWILYLGYAGLGVGLITSAAQAAGVAMPSALPVHLVAMAGFSLLIIGMLTRTALGHTGRPLTATPAIRGIYIAAGLSAVARIAAAFDLAREAMLYVSATAWVIAFAGFVIVYAPLLLRPRP